MIKTLRLAAMAALLCLALPAGADTNLRGRVNAPAHEANKGFKLPVYAGTCSAVTGQQEGDSCWNSTGDTLNVYNGSSFSTLSPTTASTAEMNTLNGAPIGTSTISCADDAGGTTSLCTVQLKDADGADLAVRGSVFIYLSADANGDAISVAPSGGWAITTDGLLISQVTSLAAQFVSESDGDIDFTITEAGALTLYVIMVLPTGKLIASSILAFN